LFPIQQELLPVIHAFLVKSNHLRVKLSAHLVPMEHSIQILEGKPAVNVNLVILQRHKEMHSVLHVGRELGLLIMVKLVLFFLCTLFNLTKNVMFVQKEEFVMKVLSILIQHLDISNQI
jgi:hypothetical protein